MRMLHVNVFGDEIRVIVGSSSGDPAEDEIFRVTIEQEFTVDAVNVRDFTRIKGHVVAYLSGVLTPKVSA